MIPLVAAGMVKRKEVEDKENTLNRKIFGVNNQISNTVIKNVFNYWAQPVVIDVMRKGSALRR